METALNCARSHASLSLSGLHLHSGDLSNLQVAEQNKPFQFAGIVQQGGCSRIKTCLVIKGLLYLYRRSAMLQLFIKVIVGGLI